MRSIELLNQKDIPHRIESIKTNLEKIYKVTLDIEAKDVSLDLLYPTREFLEKDKLALVLMKTMIENYDVPIIATKHRNDYFILDGHHRAYISKKLWKKVTRAYVLKFPRRKSYEFSRKKPLECLEIRNVEPIDDPTLRTWALTLTLIKYYEAINGTSFGLRRRDVPLENLVPTEPHITKKQIDSIEAPGVPLLCIEHRNLFYILDGHARSLRAKQLGLQSVDVLVLSAEVETDFGIVKSAQEMNLTSLADIEVRERARKDFSFIVGIATGSRRIGSGPAKVVLGDQYLGKVQLGDVLVTETTNPDMLVAMRKASAIVTDRGGITSHASIVSRELGKPCVVGTENATELIEDGMLIQVDARNGLVVRLPPNSADIWQLDDYIHKIQNGHVKYDAFISYRRDTGLDFAQHLKKGLEREKFIAFLDVADIPQRLKSSETWMKIIEAALLQSDVFILIMTNNITTSNEIKKEITMATQRDKSLMLFRHDDMSPHVKIQLPESELDLSTYPQTSFTNREDLLRKALRIFETK